MAGEEKTREIPLTRGKTALIDESDYERVSKHKWSAILRHRDNWYARCSYRANGRIHYVLLHQFILGTNTLIDHKNRNSLDNRRQNLRPATYAQNLANRRMQIHNTSGYKGVTARNNVKQRKWRASIGYDGTTHCLGTFNDPVDAARAYDVAAKKFHGEFAVLNFPEDNKE